jgi:hypothetical protein
MELSEPSGHFSNKSLIDDQLIVYLRYYIASNGYRGGLAVHALLSSIISRAEAKGESWAHYYPDDDTYDEMTENIVVRAAYDFDLS